PPVKADHSVNAGPQQFHVTCLKHLDTVFHFASSCLSTQGCRDPHIREALARIEVLDLDMDEARPRTQRDRLSGGRSQLLGLHKV
ncbi:MAG: hypothetical protein NTY38_09435, partial [Acidobacteria bacterium]|nr:hypothetical protein [Acidobacteriota bacterium]